ncbi:MAG: hypothetical protein ABH883_07610, partial [Candidatus Omnitrophota bacterium]
MFELEFTDSAREEIRSLKRDEGLAKRYKAVTGALKKLRENPRHPSLQTHQYHTLFGPNKEKIFEAYAENKTPGAYRIFFYYGSGEKVITIF